jgi:hypothetical protein
MMLGFALCSAAACTTGRASDGGGYGALTPNSGTRTYITRNDPVFTQQVASHNRQCGKDEACAK